MLTITARNVNHALPVALMHLYEQGLQIAPRGQPTIEYPMPVATVYERPCERVLWDPVRDANPFFHFFEALWILAGRKDVAFLAQFNKRMADYSDDGKTFHGAYGHRLNIKPDHSRDETQIQVACRLLRDDPDTRQVVLQIWDAGMDLGYKTKDMPCNSMIFLKARSGRLHMRVHCRSNDVVWGAYGANVVQFSMLLEYMAAKCKMYVGTYTQVSDSFHVYESNPYWQFYLQNRTHGLRVTPDLYEDGDVLPVKVFADVDAFDADLQCFFNLYDNGHDPANTDGYKTLQFNRLVCTMYRAHARHKAGNTAAAIDYMQDNTLECWDWATACRLWLERRLARQRDIHFVAP